MTFLEEIAQRIDKALDGDCGYGVGRHLAEQLSPLIAEHDAQVRAEEREQADREPSERHDSTENGSVVPPSDLRAHVRKLTGATDADLTELGGFTGEPSSAYVTVLAREFEHIWNERVETFDPEVHDETPFIEGIMRDALLAAQEVRRAD